MPTIDHERGVVVVRVVYDGPGFSGKTTTLQALAAALGVDVTTPAHEGGRTLFFDWVEYIGGTYAGHPVRCQIVSVPGQRVLADRREALLELADAIVFVADTRATQIDNALDLLMDLVPLCREADPPVGIVVQANKRDVPDSIPRDELLGLVDAVVPAPVFESVATDGRGVRDPFVFGVRMALDRVRYLIDHGQLPEGPPEVDSPDDLMKELSDLPTRVRPSLRAALDDDADTDRQVSRIKTRVPGESVPPPESAQPNESVQACDSEPPDARTLQPPAVAKATLASGPSEPPDIAVPGAAEEVTVVDVTVDEVAVPLPDEDIFVANPNMPSGYIWPPVDGRAYLYDFAQLEVVPAYDDKGNWFGRGGAWCCQSNASWIFDDAVAGRDALIQWARIHATSTAALSPRALLLVSAGRGRHRLWQVARVDRSLDARLDEVCAKASPEDVAAKLIETSSYLLQGRRLLHSPTLALPCRLTTVGVDAHDRVMFTGCMPDALDDLTEELDGRALLHRELSGPWRALARKRSDLAAIAAALDAAHQLGASTATEVLVEISANR